MSRAEITKVMTDTLKRVTIPEAVRKRKWKDIEFPDAGGGEEAEGEEELELIGVGEVALVSPGKN